MHSNESATQPEKSGCLHSTVLWAGPLGSQNLRAMWIYQHSLHTLYAEGRTGMDITEWTGVARVEQLMRVTKNKKEWGADRQPPVVERHDKKKKENTLSRKDRGTESILLYLLYYISRHLSRWGDRSTSHTKRYLVVSPVCPGGQGAEACAPGAVRGQRTPWEADASHASSSAPRSTHSVTPRAFVPATDDTWHRNSLDFCGEAGLFNIKCWI